MIDLYLKAPTEEVLNDALIRCALINDGPSEGVLLDVIGPITRLDYSVEPPVEKVYPDWHVNVRCPELTEEHAAILEPFMITPPEVPYRVWA